ncbi:MAG: UDP-4-amino-4,6-dideoxy-N-acetyl-beta-L-altrosamine transaminase [Nitrospiria bacterium]
MSRTLSRIQSIPYGRQTIEEDDVRAVVDVLKSDRLTQGSRVGRFEAAFAEYCGARYAVACSSGTAALHLAYLAAGLRRGEAVITSPISFLATANAAVYVGAGPVFADVDPTSGNIQPERIAEICTSALSENKRLKAIVPVHFAGFPCDMKEITKIADQHRLVVIEDACHALGAEVSGRRIGSYSDLTVFSFHPVKQITTGEGGAITTNDKGFYNRLIQLREHGVVRDGFLNKPDGPWYYEMQSLGFNYRMTDIQAALGCSQLKKSERFIQRRREIAGLYDDAFEGNPLFDCPVERRHVYAAYHLYPIRLKDFYKTRKQAIVRYLMAAGIQVQIHYIPIYLQPYYRGLGYRKGLCPDAEDFYAREISLPIYPGMRPEDVEYVMDTVSRIPEDI